MRVAEKNLIHAMPCYTADVPVLEATNAVSLWTGLNLEHFAMMNLVIWPLLCVVLVIYLRKKSRTKYFWCRSSQVLGHEDYIENIPLCWLLYLPLLSHAWQVIN